MRKNKHLLFKLSLILALFILVLAQQQKIKTLLSRQDQLNMDILRLQEESKTDQDQVLIDDTKIRLFDEFLVNFPEFIATVSSEKVSNVLIGHYLTQYDGSGTSDLFTVSTGGGNIIYAASPHSLLEFTTLPEMCVPVSLETLDLTQAYDGRVGTLLLSVTCPSGNLAFIYDATKKKLVLNPDPIPFARGAFAGSVLAVFPGVKGSFLLSSLGYGPMYDQSTGPSPYEAQISLINGRGKTLKSLVYP